MKIPRRSLLTGTAALGALAAMRERAEADIAFTAFPFKSTGGTAARTMPDRLAEVKNVMDFGAVGTGSVDDSVAIQNAVNWTTGANRGTIFFPIGFYRIDHPITFNYNGPLSICFKGEGSGSVLNATFASGFVLDRALGSPSNQATVIIENLWINGGSSSTIGTVAGAIRVGSCISVSVRNCHLGGNINLTTEDSAGNSSQNILLENVIFPGGDSGLIMGGAGAVIGCDWTDCLIGATMYGEGWYMAGNRMERCNTAYQFGLDSAGTDRTASGFMVTSASTEGNLISFDFAGTCSGFCIDSVGMFGHGASSPANSGVGVSCTGVIASGVLTASSTQGLFINGMTILPELTINSYTYNSGTGLVTLTLAQTISYTSGGGAGVPINVGGLNIGGLNGVFNMLSASSHTITYTGPTGQAGSPSGGGDAQITAVITSFGTGTGGDGTYNLSVSFNLSSSPVVAALGTQRGMYVRANKASGGFFNNIFFTSYADVAGIDVEASTTRANLLFLGSSALAQTGNGPGVPWIYPSNAYTAQFVLCDQTPIWTFSQLPTVGGGNDQEGDEFSISDSNTNTWGANAAGSGSNRVLVRNNNSHYTVVAK